MSSDMRSVPDIKSKLPRFYHDFSSKYAMK